MVTEDKFGQHDGPEETVVIPDLQSFDLTIELGSSGTFSDAVENAKPEERYAMFIKEYGTRNDIDIRRIVKHMCRPEVVKELDEIGSCGDSGTAWAEKMKGLWCFSYVLRPYWARQEGTMRLLGSSFYKQVIFNAHIGETYTVSGMLGLHLAVHRFPD